MTLEKHGWIGGGRPSDASTPRYPLRTVVETEPGEVALEGSPTYRRRDQPSSFSRRLYAERSVTEEFVSPFGEGSD